MSEQRENFPEKIYLQRESADDSYSDCMKGELTWCEDNVNDADVAYVRADLAALSSAPSAEPVAWEFRTYNPDADEVYYHVTTSILEAKNFDQFPCPLYAAPQPSPTAKAYAAAMLLKAANACLENEGAIAYGHNSETSFAEDVLALIPSDDMQALRELIKEGVEAGYTEAERAYWIKEGKVSAETLADRILKGE